MSSESPQPVRLELADPASRRLWSEVGRLATRVLPADWTLVGGLMVQLHAFEAGEIDVRVTNDVDILADARKRDGFQRIVRALEEDGFELQDPGAEQIGHRWKRDGLVLDLLAPEGLKDDPRVTGQIRTVQIPGGTQALARTELVSVEIDGVVCSVRRPTLLGAILTRPGRCEFTQTPTHSARTSCCSYRSSSIRERRPPGFADASAHGFGPPPSLWRSTILTA